MKNTLKNKLLVITVFLSIICCFCSGCDPYGGQYPDADEKSIWICDEAPLYFRGYNNELGFWPGCAVVDDKKISLDVGFLYGGILDINKANSETTVSLLDGECSFKKDSFKVKELYRDELFNFQYETLTFRLYYEDDVDWVDGWPVPKEGQSQ